MFSGALNEGGFQTIPKLVAPGACLIGCGGGLLNVSKLKGTHTAMWSGIHAAEGIFEDIDQESALQIFIYFRTYFQLFSAITPIKYDEKLKASPVWSELKKSRNVRPSFNTKLGWVGECGGSGRIGH